MKHCSWNYFPWGHEYEFMNSDEPELTPNPMCAWCDYIQACAARVGFWLNYDYNDMPEDAFETIHASLKHGDEEIIPITTGITGNA